MEKNDITVSVGDGILNVRVGAIIIKDNKILMVGNEHADYLYSVGGRVKMGETAEKAVVREVYEETGIKMEVECLGFIHENFFVGDTGKAKDKQVHEISFFFYMKVPEDFEPVCNSFSEGDSKEQLVWVTADTDKKYFPEFFRTEVFKHSGSVRHFVTRDVE